MKSIKLSFLLIVLAAALVAQQRTSAVLSWTDPDNPLGTTYTVYKAVGPCSPTSQFQKLAEAGLNKTWTDPTITVGKTCYQVTAVYGGMESVPSNNAQAANAPTAPVLTVTVTVNVSVTLNSGGADKQ